MRTQILTIVIAVLSCFTSAMASEAVVLEDSSSAKNAQQPQLVIDRDGVVHVAFGAGHEVFYARSDDGGLTFSKPTKMATVRNLSLGMRRGPRIGVSKNSVC